MDCQGDQLSVECKRSVRYERTNLNEKTSGTVTSSKTLLTKRHVTEI